MPLYEYECVKCGHRFEKIESLSASPVKKCPKCGAKAERQLSASAIQFKGTGWYVTDYAGKKPTVPPARARATARKPRKSPANRKRPIRSRQTRSLRSPLRAPKVRKGSSSEKGTAKKKK